LGEYLSVAFEFYKQQARYDSLVSTDETNIPASGDTMLNIKTSAVAYAAILQAYTKTNWLTKKT
jgi:hypothetical protein